MKIIIGLGNPGKEYEMTRHNVGFLALDEFAHVSDSEPFREEKKFHSLIASAYTEGEKNILVKPSTHMNGSGHAVREILGFFKQSPATILVIHDDIDLPLGSIRCASDSSSAGQKGVQSIIDTLGTKEFRRVRIGIGPKPEKIELGSFVLEPFSPDEREELRLEIFPRVTELVRAFLTE